MGWTTNPSLVAKAGANFFESLKTICDAIPGPISAEVVASDYEGMLAEGRKLRTVAKNITVKVPLTPDGLRACKTLSGRRPSCERDPVFLGRAGHACREIWRDVISPHFSAGSTMAAKTGWS